ncbi:hypothetical protein BDW72DRAFT_205803 [Aspergillus terricola var. indicus]
MEEYWYLNSATRSRARLRKACDYCRKAKVKCEKTEGSPSCIACQRVSTACIITPSVIDSSLLGLERNTPTSGRDASRFIPFKQRSKTVLYDWIYGNITLICEAPTSDLLKYAHLWKTSERLNELLHAPFPLPAEAELLQILLTFSECTASIFPLFREKIDEWLAERSYFNPGLPNDSAQWAAMNISLAMGYTFHRLQHPDSKEDGLKREGHVQNALATLPRLLLDDPSLTGVQALFGMAQHTDPERRTRVFWMGYVMDKMMCSTQGLGPFEDYTNNDIALPSSSNSAQEPQSATGIQRFPDFQVICRLSTIRARIFSSVYAAGKTNIQYGPGQLPSMEELEKDLSDWRGLIYSRCEADLGAMEATSSNQLIMVVILLAYYHSIITLYKPVYLSSDRKNTMQPIQIAACINSARKMARLIQYYPVHAHLGVRSILNHVFSSFMILSMHIVDFPSVPTACNDLRLLHELCKFLSNLIHESGSVHQDLRAFLKPVLKACYYHRKLAYTSAAPSTRRMPPISLGRE